MLRRLGVAAAMALVTGSALATNFRAADQVYVPTVGKIASSRTFITDIYVANLSTDSVTVSAIVSQGATGNQQTFPNLFTLGPLERKELKDFFASAPPNGLGIASGIGQLILNGCRQGTSCGTDTQDPNTGVSPNFRNISVESRIYSIPNNETTANNPSGTTGQLFMGFPWYNYVSQDQAANGLDKIFLVGLSQSAVPTTGFRTNIGLVNASQFSNTQLVVKLYSPTNGNTPVATSAPFGLGPLGFAQPGFTTLFPNQPFTAGMWVTVEQQNSAAISSDTNVVPASCQPAGCPAFFAYGSVVDNVTGDATTLEPQYMRALTDAQINCLYPAPGTTPCKGTPPMRRAVRH